MRPHSLAQVVPSSRLLPVLLAVVTLAFLRSATGAPSGQLAVILKGTACVVSLPSGRVTRLPHGANAQLIAASPQGTLAYFVSKVPVKPSYSEDVTLALDGFASGPPFRRANQLPFHGVDLQSLAWNANGSQLWLGGAKVSGVYQLQSHHFTSRPYAIPVALAHGYGAYSTDTEVHLTGPGRGQDKVVFSIKHPQPLFDALERARVKAGAKDLADEIDPSLWHDASNWCLGSTAFAPDGSRFFFTCNAGTGAGAAGNTEFAVFAYVVKSEKLEVLSKVGAQFGRIPDTFQVSPGGKRLLLVSSVHSSAADNPSFALVVDLLTQGSRELLQSLPEAKDRSNLVSATCWSPDGKYLAVSAYFYDVAKIGDSWDGPASNEWTTWIKDAATGATVLKIRGAQSPSWSR